MPGWWCCGWVWNLADLALRPVSVEEHLQFFLLFLKLSNLILHVLFLLLPVLRLLLESHSVVQSAFPAPRSGQLVPLPAHPPLDNFFRRTILIVPVFLPASSTLAVCGGVAHCSAAVATVATGAASHAHSATTLRAPWIVSHLWGDRNTEPPLHAVFACVIQVNDASGTCEKCDSELEPCYWHDQRLTLLGCCCHSHSVVGWRDGWGGWWRSVTSSVKSFWF